MPRFGQTLIVSSQPGTVSAIGQVLAEIGILRLQHLETPDEAWLYLETAHNKSSVKVLFLEPTSLAMADDLLKKIMAHENLSHIKVVVIANLKHEEMMNFVRHGALRIIARPFDFEKIKAMVNHIQGATKKMTDND